MRGTGAARRRREPEQDEPDPVAAAVAEVGRVVAASDAARRRLERHDRAVTGLIGEMEALAAAACPDAGRLAAAADRLSERYAMVTVELIADAAHNAEAREILERVEPRLGTIAMMRDAWIAEGRRLEAAEAAERAAQAQASGPRHARRRHLNPVPGIPTAVTRAAAAGIVAAGLTGTIAAVHEESSVRTVASAAAPARGVHRMPPDTAVLMPPSTTAPRAYVPRHARKPSADAATATPAPSPSLPVLASPSPPAPPASSSPVTSGTVNLQTVAVTVGASGQARIVFTASGTVQWSAQASGPVSLSRYGGLLGDGQSASIVVTVQGGGTGSAVVTITDQDGNATQVPVSWVALPVL